MAATLEARCIIQQVCVHTCIQAGYKPHFAGKYVCSHEFWFAVREGKPVQPKNGQKQNITLSEERLLEEGNI